MEALGKFMFPSARDTPSKPLQNLSPERVNAASRPPSTTTLSTTPTSKTTTTAPDEPQYYTSPQSPRSPPIRRLHADLFADYRPTNGPTSPKAVSTFGGLTQSPSMPEINALRAHVRTNSDVQGLVKRFEHLDVRDKDAESAERRQKVEAELRRAQIAREEAESDVRRLREEVRALNREVDEGRERERMVTKRLEVVAANLGADNDSHASQTKIYEKELRNARKEAFKSSSAVLKSQEELKSTRNSLRITQTGFEVEKQKVQRKEQERFEMEYRLIPLQEQVEKLSQKLQVAEAEKEALKTSLEKEEVLRIAAEGKIALPTSQDQDDDLWSSPRKIIASPLSDDKENIPVVAKKTVENRHLAEDLRQEKMKREHAEELVDFMRMECLFQCCPCKTTADLRRELETTLDAEMAAGLERIRKDMSGILTPPASVEETDGMLVEHTRVEEVVEEQTTAARSVSPPEHATSASSKESTAMDTVESSAPSTVRSPTACLFPVDQLREEAEQAFNTLSPTPSSSKPLARNNADAENTLTIPLQPSSPTTPTYTNPYETTPFRQQPSIRTVTTTTTIPMHFTPVSKPAQPVFAPNAEDAAPTAAAEPDSAALMTPTFDRAAALAAIEYRRGRARSLANGHATPRKQMLEGVRERRDISAPALGNKGVGEGMGSVRGRTGSASRGVGKK